MGKQPASLPEDRSEWPSFLSGGSLPKTEVAGGGIPSVPSTSTSASSVPSASSLGLSSSGLSSATSTSGFSPSTPTHHPISSSVPNPQSSGPRLHDYALKAPGGKVVVTQVRPGLLLGVNSNGDPSIPYTNSTTPASGTAYPMSMPIQQFAPTRTPHHAYGYDYGYTPIVPAGGGEDTLNGIGPPTWSLPNSSMRSVSHGRSLSSGSALSEDGDIEIDIEDEDEEYGRGRVMGRKGRNFNVEGDADGMDDDDDDEDNDDDDEHYEGHNHGQNHEDDDHNDNDEEGTQTYHPHYTTTTTRYNTPPHMKPKWDRGGLVELDIEMDMDMD